MQRSVLILAPHTDPHASALTWALQRQGINTVWMPSLQAKPGVHYAFHIGADHEYLLDSTLGADRISAVWNRRMHDPEPTCDEADRGFASLEWKLFQRNLFTMEHTYGDALWVNRLAAAQRGENKLVQLSVCRRLGLPFPETVVTTEAEQVDALRKKWGQIIFKSFLAHQWQDRESGQQHVVSVVLLDERSELPPEPMAVCPGIYQRYIHKSRDIRVTVIGEHLFALSLSKTSGSGFVDWRPHTDHPELIAEAITLPATVETKLRALMRELDLVFGCIDLAVDHDGNYYFLEVNQAGQFLFVEDMIPMYPILQTMAAMLASGRTDASISATKAVPMKQFRESEAFADLKERIDRNAPERFLFSLE